jgi:hypothetical protein
MNSNDKLPGALRIGLLAAVLALPACVSDADPREGNHELPDARADSDVRDEGARDSARTDAQDASVTQDADDGGGGEDTIDESATDAGVDNFRIDAAESGGDTADARGPDANDASASPDVGDAVADLGPSDANAGVDITDAVTVDANDAGAPIDVSDAGTPGDVSDAAGGGDANPVDSSDASDGAADGGVVVFYQELFDNVLGTFSSQTNVCGTTPQWTNNAGYAHASDPAATGVSRISSPAVTVPANTSNVVLQMSHKFGIEQGWDAASLLISVNGGTATQVATFTTGGYANGGQTNPASCALAGIQGSYQGWSGNQAEFISAVDLSAAPFNVAPGNTVTITFRMATDLSNLTTVTGWDINWVTLSANSP